MSSPDVRRPPWQSADATGSLARTNRVGADWSASRWGTSEPTDVRDADPWPPGALTSANPAVTEPLTDREPVKAPAERTRVSVLAMLCLMAGMSAVAATLTGVLVPLGVVAGVIAILFGVFAGRAVRSATVNGYGLLAAGLLFGVVAIALGLLAMSHHVSWLSNRTDEVAVLHNWLNNHIHWLRRW